ncbi:tetratricopeptide repeat protein [Rickettsia tamurae]|nr:tetratricopeptide repeat protein [Rickettsia tamurae]
MNTNLFLPNENILLKRHEASNKLNKILTQSPLKINIAVLLGVGGSGKSTIAKQYGKDQKSKIVWLLNAETKQNLIISFENLAYALCDNNMDRQELRNILNIKDIRKQEAQLIFFTQKQLKQAGTWLLIFDNVTSLQDMVNFFPFSADSWGSGALIITTRNSNITNNELIDADNVIRVGEISRAEKLELFKKITKKSASLNKISQDKIEEFLDQIPSFPLDVSLAANYLNFTKTSLTEYVSDIQLSHNSFNELQSAILEEVQQYSSTRYNIISVALQDILNKNAAFKELMFLISMLDSQDIPKDLLYLTKDQYTSNHFIKDLSKNSLIADIYNHEQSLNNISIHRSTQNNILIEMLRLLSENQRHEYIANIIKNIQAYVLKKVDLEDITNLKNLIRHCEALLNRENMISPSDITSLKTDLGLIYYYLGRDAEAREILEQDLSKINKDQELAIIYTHLGAIYRKLGQDYNQAISYLEKALKLYDSENHLGKGLALTHLGNTYRTIGNLEKATTILKDSADTYRRNNTTSVGEIRALGYLGVAYREQGELEAASTCLEDAKAIYEQNGYSQYNSLYAGTLAHLAITYRMVGQYHNAKDVLEKSTEIYKSIRPQDHPDIGRNTLNLGIIYGELREEKQAKAFLEKSLADYERNYGSEHIETGKVLNHLGRFYTLVEEYQKAENVLNRAKQILKKHAHPEYYRSQELIGDINKALFKAEIAKQNYLEALEYAKKYFPQNSSNITRIIEKLQRI